MCVYRHVHMCVCVCERESVGVCVRVSAEDLNASGLRSGFVGTAARWDRLDRGPCVVMMWPNVADVQCRAGTYLRVNRLADRGNETESAAVLVIVYFCLASLLCLSLSNVTIYCFSGHLS